MAKVLTEQSAQELTDAINRYLDLNHGWRVHSFSTAYAGMETTCPGPYAVRTARHRVQYSALLVRDGTGKAR